MTRFLSSTRTQLAMLFTVLCAATSMLAQQAVTRVEGFIRDEVTNTPVGCKLYVVGPGGKKLTLSSNSTDGSYLMVLNDAGDYKLALIGHMVYRREYNITVPPTSKFQEIKRDYNVKTVHEGDVVFSTIGFDRNSSALSASGKKELNALLDVLKVNQEMNIIVTILPDEDLKGKAVADAMSAYNKEHAKWEKDMATWKKKNKKKQTTEPPVEPMPPTTIADPNEQIVKDRKVAVLSYLHEVKNSDLRVIVQTEVLPASAAHQAVAPAPEVATGKKSKKTKATPAPPKHVQAPAHNNLVTKIGKVKRLFE